MSKLSIIIVGLEELGNKKCYVIFSFRYSFNFMAVIVLWVNLCPPQN